MKRLPSIALAAHRCLPACGPHRLPRRRRRLGPPTPRPPLLRHSSSPRRRLHHTDRRHANAVCQPLGGQVTLVTHDSFAATDSVLSDFSVHTGVTLNVLKGGDAGTMVNQAILTKDAPLGDVLYGVDNTFLSRALDAGIFEPYQSARARRCAGRAPARPRRTA